MGGGLAQVISSHVPDVEVTAETSNASAANINLLSTHEVTMGIVQNDVAYRASKGEKPFTAPITNLRMIASLYPEHLHCVTLKGSGVTKLDDIRGKRVSVGAPGSGVEASVKLVLEVAGMSYDDFKPDFQDYAQTAERLQDDQLAAGFLLTGYPTSAIMSLAAQKEIDIVPLDEGLLDKLLKTYPFFTKDVIPAGAYAGVNHDTLTAAVLAVLVCDASLSDDLVYNITKAIFENLDELKPVHDKAKLISLDKALEAPAVPVHPGAAKYYTEKGLKVPQL
jgi:TRAP transporter TAXI family solute receptor